MINIKKLQDELLQQLKECEDINTLYIVSKTILMIDDFLSKNDIKNRDKISKKNIALANRGLRVYNNLIKESVEHVKEVEYRTITLFNLNKIISSVDIDNTLQGNLYLEELQSKGLDLNQIREHLISSHLNFCKFMFHELEGTYKPTQFDEVFSNTIDKVLRGEITRLVINIPVGMGKTARGVIATVALGFAIQPKSKFLHISYDRTLAYLNSSTIRDLITSENYKKLFGINLKEDTTSKGLWRTNVGGMFRAVSSGSGITGFRAGNIALNGFSGAMIIDDPLKPDDALSETKRTFINNRFETTFKSRLAKEEIPIIVIMQRLHKEDFTNHILERYNDWHKLIIPAWVEKKHIILTPDKYRIPLQGIKEGALWEEKYSLKVLEQEKLINPYYFFSQLQQEPIKYGDREFRLLRSSWLNEYDKKQFIKEVAPKVTRVIMTADTANTINDWSDYTVISVFAHTSDNKIYLLYMFRNKVEFHRLEEIFNLMFINWQEVMPKLWKIPRLSQAYIEDKASGTSLIQVIRAKHGYPVLPIKRHKDKVSRVSNVSSLIYQGYVYIPSWESWKQDIKIEFDEFNTNDTHRYDDIIDTFIDAIDILIVPHLNQDVKKSLQFNQIPI